MELENRQNEEQLLHQENDSSLEKQVLISKRQTLNEDLVKEINRKLSLAEDLT